MKKIILLLLFSGLYCVSAFSQTYCIKANKVADDPVTGKLKVEFLLSSNEANAFTAIGSVIITGTGSISGVHPLAIDQSNIGGGSPDVKFREQTGIDPITTLPIYATTIEFDKVANSTAAASFTIDDVGTDGIFDLTGANATILTRNCPINCIISPTVAITCAETDQTICAGSSVTFNVTSTYHAGTTPQYQWKINGVNSGSATTSTSFTTSTLANGDIVTAELISDISATSTLSCVEEIYNLGAAGVKATSNGVMMTVNPVPVVTVTSPVSIVYGTTGAISLTANLTVVPASPVPNSGTVQFSVNGTAVGSPVTVSNGVATLTGYVTSVLPVGDYIISATYSGTATHLTAAGFCPVNTSTNGTLTITKRPLNFSGTKVYNGTTTFIPTQLTLSNIVNSDAVTVTGTADVSSKNVGSYTAFSANGLGSSNPNYIVTGGMVSVSIDSATLSITATDSSKVYGSARTFAGTEFTVTGLQNSDAVASVTLASAGAAASASVGTYPIIASAATGTGLSNYIITYNNGSLKVDSATLNITATDSSKCFNLVMGFTGTEFRVTGLQNSDAVASVTLASAGAAATAAVGSYPIVPSAAMGTGLSNYTINYANGSLEVLALPVASITGTTTICTGTTTTLTASSNQGTPEYDWNSTSFSATPTFTTIAASVVGSSTYSVVVKNTATGCLSTPQSVTVISNDCAPKLAIKVLLEGAYDPATAKMKATLRSAGTPATNRLPLTQPFGTRLFGGLNNATTAYSGTEAITPSVLAQTGDTAIVDWVLVEVRKGTEGDATVEATRAALLRQDGKVVDMDGYSPVRFGNGGPPDYSLMGNYHISVRHRLCLPIRTATTVAIMEHSATSVVPTIIDFSTTTNALTGSTKTASDGKKVLITGDTDRNSTINTQDIVNIRARNPTPVQFFQYMVGYDLDFNVIINVTDVLMVRSNSGNSLLNLKQ